MAVDNQAGAQFIGSQLLPDRIAVAMHHLRTFVDENTVATNVQVPALQRAS